MTPRKSLYPSIISNFKRFVKLTISIIILCVCLVTPVSATIPDDSILDMFDTNGIYYYNPSGTNNCTSTSTTLKGNGTIEKIWNFFIEKGFNDAQTAGILGNAHVETGGTFSPTVSSSGSFWGLFQWGGNRQISLHAKIREAGLEQYLSSTYWDYNAYQNIPAQDLDTLLKIELEFAISDPENIDDWQTKLKTSNTPEESAEIFLVLFERAINGDDEILYYSPYAGLLYQGTTERRDNATALYKKYSGHGTTNANNCNVTGEFTSLVKAYAWPNYHRAPFVERMPTYAAAVTKSQSEGRYVGGSVRGVAGIDCGGFVTILIQNSGLEPRYNTSPSGNSGSSTGYQEKWVQDNGWVLINASKTTPVDTSRLQPGDVAFSGGTDYHNNAHTFIYVGNIPGFNEVIASASYSSDGSKGRAPMAGGEDLIYDRYNDRAPSIVRWYRKN